MDSIFKIKRRDRISEIQRLSDLSLDQQFSDREVSKDN